MLIKEGYVFLDKSDECQKCIFRSGGCILQYMIKVGRYEMDISINKCNMFAGYHKDMSILKL